MAKPSRPARVLRGTWRWTRRLITTLAILVVLILVLLAGAQTYLDTDGGRARLASILSGVLGQDVTLGSVELHLLSGLTVGDVKLVPRGDLASQPFLIADQLVLGYSLSELLHGTLRIDHLALSGAKLAIVFRGKNSNLPLAGGGAAPTVVVVVPAPGAAVPPAAPGAKVVAIPAPKHGIAIPPLPVNIELDELRLADVTLLLDLDGATRVESRGLDLNLDGHAGSQGTDLTLHASHRPGDEHDLQVTVNGARAIRARGQLALDLHVHGPDLDTLAIELALALPGASLDLGAGARPVTFALKARGEARLSKAEATLDPLTLDLGTGGSLQARVKLVDFLSAPVLDASVPHAHFDLGELLPLAAPFLPALTAAGRVEIENLAAHGDLAGGTEQAPFTASGKIVLAGIDLGYPDVGITATGLDGNIDLARAKLVHYLPAELAANGGLTLTHAGLPDGGRAEHASVTLDATANGTDFRAVRAHVEAHVPTLVPPALGPGATPLAVDAQVTANADLTTGNLTGIDVVASVPKALDLHVTGDVGAFGKGPIAVKASIAAQPGPLLTLVPRSLLGGMAVPNASGSIAIDATATGDLGRRAVASAGTVKLAKLSANELPAHASLGSASGELAFDVSLADGFQPGPAKISGNLAVERVQAIDAVDLASASLSIDAATNGAPPTDATAKLDLKLTGARYRTPDLETPLQDVKLHLAARGDPTHGNLTLDDLDLLIDRGGHLTAKGSARAFGREALEARARLDGLSLATVAMRLPRSIGSAVSGISATGAPTLDVDVKGRLPNPDEIRSLTLPLTSHVAFELPKASLAWPERQLNLPRASAKLGLAIDPANVAVDLDAGAFELVDRPHLGSESWDLTATVHARLEDRDRLTLSQAYFGVLNRGGFAFAGGELSGIRPVLEARALPPLGEILRSVAGQLEVAAGFARPSPTEMAPGLTVKGGSSTRVTVKLRPGRDLAIEGQAFFADLDAKQPPSLDVTGLSGRFPIQKTLRIVTADTKPSSSAPGARDAARSGDADPSVGERNRSVYGALRPLSANRDNLRLANLVAGPLAAHDIYLDIAFADRALELDRFGVGLLGGWVGGNAETSFSPARNRLLFSTEFGEIDLRKLLPLQNDLADEEAQVSGTARVAVDLARGEGSGTVSLGDLNADLTLTRIGERALDQLLVFLDPKGDQSSISTFRTILKTTDLTINRVEIPIQNGSLTVRVEYGIHAHVPRFLERALNIVYDTTNRFEVPAIDLLKLSNVQDLQAAFAKLDRLKPVLDVVGGDRIRIEPDGSFRIE